jgi:hypothetical protein
LADTIVVSGWSDIEHMHAQIDEDEALFLAQIGLINSP